MTFTKINTTTEKENVNQFSLKLFVLMAVALFTISTNVFLFTVNSEDAMQANIEAAISDGEVAVIEAIEIKIP